MMAGNGLSPWACLPVESSSLPTRRAAKHGGFTQEVLWKLGGVVPAPGENPFPAHGFPSTLFAMRPSEALTIHRTELRQLVSRYNVTHPRVYGSVLTGEDDEESDLDILVDATPSTTLFTQTLQVGMLNDSFLLIFQGFIPYQAPKWKRLLLPVDRLYNPRKMAS
jgi:predicted nucleotidyltransferase